MSDPRQQSAPPTLPPTSSQQQQQQQQSAFGYSSSTTHTPTRTDLSLREIIDTYRDNQELLKQVLAAKAEEDKFKTEQLRLQCKQVELEMLREQRKPPTIITGMPPITTNYSVKSPSDIHSPSYSSIPPPIGKFPFGTVDTHYSTTTPTSATRLSPPSSASNADTTSFSSLTNPSSSGYQIGQRPALTLAIPSPSFPLVTSSPTSTHAPNSYSTTPTTLHDSSHHHTPHRHHHHTYTQSPTSATSAGPSTSHKRSKPEPEVDHQYVMEAIRQKVRQNAENPAKKQAVGVGKTRSSSTPVVSITSPAGTTSAAQSSSPHTRSHSSSHSSTHSHPSCAHNGQHVHSPHTAQPHPSPHSAHPQHQSPHQHVSSPVHAQASSQSQQQSSTTGAPLAHSPLPPMTVHSPVLNQEGVAKS